MEEITNFLILSRYILKKLIILTLIIFKGPWDSLLATLFY